MNRKPDYRIIARAFFSYGYSVETIAGYYKIEALLVEDQIRRAIKKGWQP